MRNGSSAGRQERRARNHIGPGRQRMVVRMHVQALHDSPGKQRASTAQALYATGIVLLLTLFVLVTYTFLHEGGHAVVGLLMGGTVTAFNLNFLNLSAHVGIEGDFTTFQNCVISLAGVSLPLLIWGVLVSLAPRT